MQIIQKLKLWGVAFVGFMLALMTAKHYKGKARRLKKQVINEKAKVHNYESQIKAAKLKQSRYREEIDEAVKSDTHLDYFDES